MKKKPVESLKDVKQLKFDWHVGFPIIEEEIKVKVKDVQENTEQVACLDKDLPDFGEILEIRFKN